MSTLSAATSTASTHFLLYHSRATTDLPISEVLTLLTQAQTHNLCAGITGLLCYSEGMFVQFLEGPSMAVHELYTKIQQDPRHHQVTTLRAGVAAQRCLAQCSMAFTEVSPLEYYWFVHQAFTCSRPQAAAHELIANPLLLTLLAAFQY